MKRIFVTGISTEVGKTVAAAIITEALQADYWKPIQAGDLDQSDSHRIRDLVSNQKTVIHPNAYALKTPMSPHAAAAIDGINISLSGIHEPETDNTLVIEGAGGILVPLNDEDTILDLIKPHYNVVVVSRHYLGSINHSLLTLYQLQQRGLRPAIMFSGAEHPSTEEIILKKSGATYLGRIDEENSFDKSRISFYAERFRPALAAL
ncbi:dethiobiotin synthase [Zeaxanthinibacter enoshimensis]|uniref:dethiobiotin synthase n=1 Tax=Zeaxanthinibacter enoshimensis TaxID=392009 RepID=UPI0035693803